jgi:hypothetical protein
MADQPVRSAAQATSAAAGPPSPVPGWVEMARAVLLRVCPSLHPLQTLLCAAFCAPEAVVSWFLPVARDQRMLVSIGALRGMLLAIACLGHLQQRSGSDLPQLRAGVLQWVTSPGIPAAETFEVTSHPVCVSQSLTRVYREETRSISEVLRIRIVNPSNQGFLMYTWFCNMTVTKRNACSY